MTEFEGKHNEEIGHYEQTLSRYFREPCTIFCYKVFLFATTLLNSQ